MKGGGNVQAKCLHPRTDDSYRVMCAISSFETCTPNKNCAEDTNVGLWQAEQNCTDTDKLVETDTEPHIGSFRLGYLACDHESNICKAETGKRKHSNSDNGTESGQHHVLNGSTKMSRNCISKGGSRERDSNIHHAHSMRSQSLTRTTARKGLYLDHFDKSKHTSMEKPFVHAPKTEHDPVVDDNLRSKNNMSKLKISQNPLYQEETKDRKQAGEPFSLRKLPTRDKIIILVTCATYFLEYLALSIMAPFYPNETERRNISSTLSGWVFSSFPLTQFIFAPIVGKLLPKLGSMCILLYGGFLSGGSTLLFGFVSWFPVMEGSWVFLTLCFLLRIVAGIGCSSAMGATFTMCVEHFADNITVIFGTCEIFVGLGLIVGPALGGLLYSVGGFLLPFATVGGIIILNVPINYLLLRNTSETERKPPFAVKLSENSITAPKKKACFWILLFHPLAVVNSFAVVGSGLSWSVLDPTLALHLKQFGLGPERTSLMFLLMAVCYSVSCPIFGYISKKLPDGRIYVIIGYTLSAAVMCLLGPSPLLMNINEGTLWMNIIALIGVGIAGSLCLVTTFDIYLDIAGSLGFEENVKTFSMVTGLFQSVYALGELIGPSLGGALTESYGFEWCTTIVALIGLFVATITTLSFACDGRYYKRCIVPIGGGNKTKDTSKNDLKSSLHLSLPPISDMGYVLESYPQPSDICY